MWLGVPGVVKQVSVVVRSAIVEPMERWIAVHVAATAAIAAVSRIIASLGHGSAVATDAATIAATAAAITAFIAAAGIAARRTFSAASSAATFLLAAVLRAALLSSTFLDAVALDV